jgi:hypothetical protein
MASTLLPNGRNTWLPISPTDGQVFVDSEFVRWVYSAELDLWERSGTVDSIPLATSDIPGYMSPSDKRLIDNTPAVGGGFGIITDTKLILQSPTNPEGVIQGDIELRSESLDIVCVSSDKVKLNCVPPAGVLECASPTGEAAGLMFKLSDKFLDTLYVDLPGPKGKKGLTGDKGNQGKHGFSDGPKGNQGLQGESIDELCELKGITFVDKSGMTDEAIVDLKLLDNDGHGCKLIVTKSKINISDNEPADKVKAGAISRSIVYPPNPGAAQCNLTRLDDWTLAKGAGDATPLNMQLLRLPKGSNDREGEPVGFNGTMDLNTFVTQLVDEYKNRLVKLDQQWGKQVKEYIQSIDDKARTILSGLANELAMCEFNLPAVEYGIVFKPCIGGSPSAAAASRASGVATTPVGKMPTNRTVQMGRKSWRVKS